LDEVALVDGRIFLVVKHAPKTFAELRQFYVDVYTPLYDRFINSGAAPQELHAESAACLDHLFCYSNGDIAELKEEDIRRAAGHLKRATFDGFKLIFEQTRVMYQRFMDDRYAEVHDGAFRQEITEKWKQAVSVADAARPLERRTRNIDYASWDSAFEKWQELLPIADYFIALLTDKTVTRALAKTRRQRIIAAALWILSIVLSAALGVALNWCI
jgi:hypothetical protein